MVTNSTKSTTLIQDVNNKSWLKLGEGDIQKGCYLLVIFFYRSKTVLKYDSE